MLRVKLILEYDGSNYVGWQRQNNGKSIQGEIEKSLVQIFNEHIELTVAGRTDAGVHAFGQVAHFDLKKKVIDEKKIYKAINYFLKQNNNKITVLSSKFVNQEFHSRFSVKRKIYLYRIHNRETNSHLLSKRVWFVPQKITLVKMRRASKYLIGKHDFNAFRSSGCQAKQTLRTIDDISIEKENDCIEIRVKGKSFMHNQVRIIVGTLIKVGMNKLSELCVKNIINSKNRNKAGPTAPAEGLYLEKIVY
ncbi:MAG: tRNA pseudouridine(38-40) synthase TruA [Alphaproteobacteria bacterium]|nr:tRNA pseudouridine(38-40) synthase TruA [Alphaproteobacteria bacterium]|tara:strand:+ start:69 stop:815 length:747 start_codon:yes stop_codon:yes gene_type:complete